MLGEIKNACHPDQVERLRDWLEEARQAARAQLLDVAANQPRPHPGILSPLSHARLTLCAPRSAAVRAGPQVRSFPPSSMPTRPPRPGDHREGQRRDRRAICERSA